MRSSIVRTVPRGERVVIGSLNKDQHVVLADVVKQDRSFPFAVPDLVDESADRFEGVEQGERLAVRKLREELIASAL